MKVLVTGGAGYIGAHACVELLAAGHAVVVVDNLCNSDGSALDGIAEISGVCPEFVQADVRDHALLSRIMREHAVEAVLHFAALKDVGESCRQPLAYFDNNVGGTLGLLRAMDAAGVTRLVFSSSAAVYGESASVPVCESAPLVPTSPYGRSKLTCEQLIADAVATRPGFDAVILRYFNPAGAHPSAAIGEPRGAGSLVSCLARVASGQCGQLTVFGRDYPTVDGTGVRDYVHVLDIAAAHVQALALLRGEGGVLRMNLGAGHGLSVLEVVAAFERASGRRIALRFAPRRTGDVACSHADPVLARMLLDWQPRLGIERICADAWRWQQRTVASAGGCMPTALNDVPSGDLQACSN